jgi:hypothetical protein
MRWTDLVTLRKSSALGSFATDSFLPIRYGRTAGTCARMNAAGTRWLWADHAVDGVDEVRLSGEKITGWIFANEIDASGRAIAVITLTEKADAGAELFATGRGKPGLTNPADVACDALSLSASDMPKFRAECARRGYIAAGSITAPVTRQSLARSIAASFGAIFTPGLLIAFPDLSAPVAIEPGAIYTSGAPVGEIVASFDFADGEPRQTVTLRTRVGDAEAVSLEWVQSQRVAEAIGKLIAIERSGQLWAFEFLRRSTARLSAGAAVSFTLAPFGAKSALVTESAFDFDQTSGTAEFRMTGATTATLVHQSARFDPDAGGSVTITRVGDEVQLVVLDEDTGAPLSNAKCTLDARMTRYTDAGGRVTFPAYAVDDGLPHSVLVEQSGRPSFTISL